LLGISPVLERAFDWSKHRGAMILLTGYQTPAQLRAACRHRLVAWLAKRGVSAPEAVADAAIEAACAQHITLPGETVAARLVKDLSIRILALNDTACKDTCPTREQTPSAIDSTPRWPPDLTVSSSATRAAATRGPTPRS
jgi:hypothetical protein